LANEPAAMDYFDAAVAAARAPAVNIAHWIIGNVFAALAQDNRAWADCAVSPRRLAELVDRVVDGSISNAQGKQVFRLMWESGRDAARIVAEQGFEQVSDTAFIDAAVAQVIADHPTQVADYRAGKTKILSFLVGQVLKATRGKANPELVKNSLARALDAP